MAATKTRQTPDEFGSGENPVLAAVELAWTISELYFERLPAQVRLLSKDDSPGWSGGLPELGTLPGWERASQTADRIKAQLANVTGTAVPWAFEIDTDTTAGDLKESLFDLHLRVFRHLAASSSRTHLGYRLGVALAHTVMAVRKPVASPLATELDRYRVATILDWLGQLKRSLPAHSADAVSYGLEQWRDWAAKPANVNDATDAVSAIGRQGRLWRDVLIGNRVAEDLLAPTDYVRAGTRMARWLGRLLLRFLASWVGLAIILTGALLAGAAYWLYRTGVDLTKVVAVALALLAPLGITATSAQATLKRAIGSMQRPLWDALLAEAIGEAAYVAPRGRTLARAPRWRRIRRCASSDAEEHESEQAEPQLEVSGAHGPNPR